MPALFTCDVQRGVPGNRHEPRARVSHLAAPQQSVPCADERLLQRVLAARGTGDAAAACKEHRPVALHEGFEGAFVAESGQLEQMLIGLVPCESARAGGGEDQLHRLHPSAAARLAGANWTFVAFAVTSGRALPLAGRTVIEPRGM